MKRILFAALALLLLMATAASAESLFTLITPAPTNTPAPASAAPVVYRYPSYEAMTDEIPFMTKALDDGSTQLTFTNVSSDNFLNFGTLLSERGFSIDMASYTIDGLTQTMTLFEGEHAFTICYDQERLMLLVTYPEGAVLEARAFEDPFTSYFELRGGETFRVSGGTFTFGGYRTEYSYSYMDYTIHQKVQGYAWDSNARRTYTGYSWSSKITNKRSHHCLLFSFNNLNRSKFSPLYLVEDITLHYVNADNHYTYTGISVYPYAQSSGDAYRTILIKDPDAKVHYSYEQPSLSTINYIQDFSLPKVIADATDGIIAVTFTIGSDNTNYVVYLRRPAQ